MIKKAYLFSLVILLGPVLYAQPGDRYAYIERFKDIAISEMERAGVPASIKLGQGILESGGGSSTLARKANNHFGIKCHSSWQGKGYYIEDDDYDQNGKIIKSCFRVYKNADASYVAHSEFLRDPKKIHRYGFLFRLDPMDYKSWAYGLKRAGYATSATYAQKLVNVIEAYELYKYDQIAASITPPDKAPDIAVDKPNSTSRKQNIFRVNDAKVVVALKGDTPSELSDKFNVSTKKLIKYNEQIRGANTQLKDGDRVYLQRKRNFYREKKEWHYVKAGESMFSISQLYGIKLKKLYKKNRIPEGRQPAVGEKIKLRWKVQKDEIPRLRSRGQRDDIATNTNTAPGKNNTGSGNVNENGDVLIDLEPDDGVSPFEDADGRVTDRRNSDIDEEDPEIIDPDDAWANDRPTRTNTSPVNDPWSSDIPEDNWNDNNSTTNDNPWVSDNPPVTDHSNNNSGNVNDQPHPPISGGNTNGSSTNDPWVSNDPPSSSNSGGNSRPPTDSVPVNTVPEAAYYFVIKGDTLYSISRRYGSSVDRIIYLNNLGSNIIQPGQKLRIR